MSTHVLVFQWFFIFLHYFMLAKLATSSIRVNNFRPISLHNPKRVNTAGWEQSWSGHLLLRVSLSARSDSVGSGLVGGAALPPGTAWTGGATSRCKLSSCTGEYSSSEIYNKNINTSKWGERSPLEITNQLTLNSVWTQLYHKTYKN